MKFIYKSSSEWTDLKENSIKQWLARMFVTHVGYENLVKKK